MTLGAVIRAEKGAQDLAATRQPRHDCRLSSGPARPSSGTWTCRAGAGAVMSLAPLQVSALVIDPASHSVPFQTVVWSLALGHHQAPKASLPTTPWHLVWEAAVKRRCRSLRRDKVCAWKAVAAKWQRQ